MNEKRQYYMEKTFDKPKSNNIKNVVDFLHNSLTKLIPNHKRDVKKAKKKTFLLWRYLDFDLPLESDNDPEPKSTESVGANSTKTVRMLNVRRLYIKITRLENTPQNRLFVDRANKSKLNIPTFFDFEDDDEVIESYGAPPSLLLYYTDKQLQDLYDGKKKPGWKSISYSKTFDKEVKNY